MTSVASTPESPNRWTSLGAWRTMFLERPLIPLLGLLVLLVILSELARPGIVTPNWAGVIIRAAIPLAILAGCQTIAMLTGGIDLSVGSVASMSGFVVATLVAGQGLPVALLVALLAAALAGTLTGIGVGVFKVHPLIMTLGMSLVVLGLANVWQIVMVQTGAGTPTELRTIGTGTVAELVPDESTVLNAIGGLFPYSLLVFVPIAAAILIGVVMVGRLIQIRRARS